MKKIIACLIVANLFTGCASYMAVKDHNDQLNQKALMMRIDAQANGQPTLNVGIDLLNARGYLGAWKESPAKMTMATIIDGLLAYGAYNLTDSSNKNDTKSAGQSQEVSVQFGGDINGNTTVNVYTGTNDNNNDNDNHVDNSRSL